LNVQVYYTMMDSEHRPYRLLRHTLGTDPNTDELLYTEDDQMLW
jgi:oligopeptidase B